MKAQPTIERLDGPSVANRNERPSHGSRIVFWRDYKRRAVIPSRCQFRRPFRMTAVPLVQRRQWPEPRRSPLIQRDASQ
jgi:hypothetical protein